MAPALESLKLMAKVFAQFNKATLAAMVKQIDWDKLAAEIGTTVGGVRKRWERLLADMRSGKAYGEVGEKVADGKKEASSKKRKLGDREGEEDGDGEELSVKKPRIAPKGLKSKFKEELSGDEADV